MSKREITVGSTDQTIDILVLDSSSTVGAGLAGLVFNSASLACYYRKGATGSATALTLATQTVGGAHSDGGFVEIQATNMKGLYRLDLSDTMVAAAGMLTIYLYGATNMAPVVAEIEVKTATSNEVYSRIGAPAGASIAADLLTIDNLVDDLESRIGTPSDLGGGATIAFNLSDIEAQTDDIGAAGAGLTDLGGMSTTMKAQVQVEAEDALQSHHVVLVKTTIATLASQTSFTLTAGSADNSAYVGCEVVIEDASTAAQKAVAVCSAYTGATKTVTLLTDPAVFTMAATDIVTIRPSRALKATVDNRTLAVGTDNAAQADVAKWLGTAAATPTVAGVPEVDVTHWIGTAAATPTTAGVPEVDVTYWRGTIVPAEHTAGYPIVTVKDGTGTGEINTNAGAIALVELVTTCTTLTNGVALLASGLDLVLVESSITPGAALTNDAGTQLSSINARQSLSIIAAACGAVLAGAATTNVTIKGAGLPSGNTRLDAIVDSSGNRSSISIKVPT